MIKDSAFILPTTKSLESNNLVYDNINEQIDKITYKPTISNEKDKVFKHLGLPTMSTSEYDLDTSEISADNRSTLSKSLVLKPAFREEIKLQQWKLIENISSKLISYDEQSLILECLVDREQKNYEEREFKRTPLFNGYALEVGKFFKICLYERDNQTMIEIKDDPNLILESDFPTIDFFEKFGHLEFNK